MTAVIVRVTQSQQHGYGSIVEDTEAEFDARSILDTLTLNPEGEPFSDVDLGPLIRAAIAESGTGSCDGLFTVDLSSASALVYVAERRAAGQFAPVSHRANRQSVDDVNSALDALSVAREALDVEQSALAATGLSVFARSRFPKATEIEVKDTSDPYDQGVRYDVVSIRVGAEEVWNAVTKATTLEFEYGLAEFSNLFRYADESALTQPVDDDHANAWLGIRMPN